jgi:HlyD family secretion protein
MAKNNSSRWATRFAILIALAAAAAGGGWYYEGHGQQGPSYTTEKVERGDLTQTVTATGTLNPVVNVTVGSQVSGRICKLYVDYNSTVKSNEVIAEIDPSTYQAALEQAKADLAEAKANEELQAANAKRSIALFKNKLIAEADYDTAIATLHEAEATVQIKEASLHNAEANLGYCKVVSPVDGTVISRAVELGQTVASSFNTPTLFKIANDLTKMQIDTSVDEADIGGVKEGETADFTVGAYPDRTYHGVVIQVRNEPSTSNNVVTYDTVISVTNADYSLKPGMTASVSIEVARHPEALEIPNSALRFEPPDLDTVETNTPDAGGQVAKNTGGDRFDAHHGKHDRRPGSSHDEHPAVRTVYVLKADADRRDPRLEPVQVVTGITDNIHTEVLSGLKEGDEVVTGLEIPGLTQAAGVRNPFGFHHHF